MGAKREQNIAVHRELDAREVMPLRLVELPSLQHPRAEKIKAIAAAMIRQAQKERLVQVEMLNVNQLIPRLATMVAQAMERQNSFKVAVADRGLA